MIKKKPLYLIIKLFQNTKRLGVYLDGLTLTPSIQKKKNF